MQSHPHHYQLSPLAVEKRRRDFLAVVDCLDWTRLLEIICYALWLRFTTTLHHLSPWWSAVLMAALLMALAPLKWLALALCCLLLLAGETAEQG